jgi:putative tryptophan/tyrosine transport system substrate-binding protein
MSSSIKRARDRRAWWKLLLSLFLAVATTANVVGCQQAPEPKQTVVILTPVPFDILDESIAGIREGLTQSGYGPDRLDVRVVNAGGQMQMLSGYSREILAGHPDVVVPVSTPATQAVVAAAPASQNIVFSTVTNPEAANVPANARNITGVSDVVNYRANILLVRELFPSARRLGTIYNPGDDAAVYGLRQLQTLAAAEGFQLRAVAATNSNEAVIAARSLADQVDVILIGSDSNAAAAMSGIVQAALAKRVPVVASDAGSVRSGALAAVSVDYRQLGRASGRLIVQVLRSGRPAGEAQRIAFVGNSLVANRATARSLGYTFPQSFVARHPAMVGSHR